jgi:hypothetical protein
MADLSMRLLRSVLILVCATVYCSMLSADGVAGELGKAKLSEKPIQVLGGRLTVRMPEGAKIEARTPNIMSAPEAEEHETRVVFDAGEERLVLMVHETFAFAREDTEKEVRDWVTKWNRKYRIEPIQLPTNRLRAVAVIPLNFPDHIRSDDATFVEGVFVESDDRTIQTLDLYVNAAAEKDPEGCKAVARQILLSVAPGAKKLQLAAGERRLFAFSKALEISVMVPANTVATKQVGPDFLVHRLIILGRLGADSGSMGIYIGDHPNLKPGAKKGVGVMLGKKIEWQSLTEGQGVETLCELSIPGDPHPVAHVWVRAPNDSQLQALKQAAESMKLVEVKKPGSN